MHMRRQQSILLLDIVDREVQLYVGHARSPSRTKTHKNSLLFTSDEHCCSHRYCSHQTVWHLPWSWEATKLMENSSCNPYSKSNELLNPTKYRSIPSLSILSKLLEKHVQYKPSFWTLNCIPHSQSNNGTIQRENPPQVHC